MKDHFTLVVPWTSSKDWTDVFIKYFKGILEPYAAISLIQGPPNGEGSLGWLVPKLRTSEMLMEAAAKGQIGNKILLLDPNHVNICALRAMVSQDVRIYSLVNGGAFQDHDIEIQHIPARREAMKSYELGFFSLCDVIITPTLHARRIFLDAYPSLESKTYSIPFPLRNIPNIRKEFEKKSGLISVGRPAFEKGSDILAESHDVYRCGLMEPSEYLEAVSTALAVVVPARAELFGYCPIETLQCGTLPIVPNGLSYPELIDIPNDLMLSNPVGGHTVEEIKSVWKKVSNMERQQYESIVKDANASLLRKLDKQDMRFLDLLCS